MIVNDYLRDHDGFLDARRYRDIHDREGALASRDEHREERTARSGLGLIGRSILLGAIFVAPDELVIDRHAVPSAVRESPV